MTPDADTPLRLLVAGEDPRFSEYLQLVLTRATTRFEIQTLDQPDAALTTRALGRHDVCVMDQVFGGENVLDLLRRWRASGVRTPIVLLTQQSDEALEFAALREGAAECLSKVSLTPKRVEQAILRAIARRPAETTLTERKARLAEAEAFAHVMVTHMSLDGRWFKVPRRFCDLLGYTEEALRARRVADVIHPEDRVNSMPPLRRLLAGTVRSVEAERRYVRRDGEVVWMYQNSSRVDDENGRPWYFLTYLRDITEQKRAEEALRSAKQRYSSILRNAPHGIFEATRDGRFLLANPALVAMIGGDADETLHGVDSDALFGGSAARRALFEKLARAGRSPVEATLARRDGSKLLVRITADVPADEKLVMTGVIEDITEYRQLEERLRSAQKMEAVGRLAAGVAHDFNNLLTAIVGCTEFLKESCVGMPEAQTDLQNIHDAARSAAALTGQLLAFSRQQVFRKQVLSVNTVVERTLALLSRALGEDLAVVTELGADVPAVEADPGQLQQVLVNLATNARDAMPRGGRLTITSSRMAVDTRPPHGTSLPAGLYAAITVADTGCGMDPATHERIFEPFFTTKGLRRGNGLGLATVYGIVKQSRGEIVCETSLGAGTTFTIFLPATGTAPRAAATGAPPVERRTTATVLLVEDRLDVRQLTRRILERQGFHVLEAADPAAALRMTQESPVDLLLTDVVMPDMSGPDLWRRVRERHPAMRVLFMSGFIDHSALRDVADAPFVEKPFTPEGLVQQVQAVLKGECVSVTV